MFSPEDKFQKDVLEPKQINKYIAVFSVRIFWSEKQTE